MARLDFRGAAAKCTVPAGMTDSVLSVTLDGDVSNWPTGATGRDFVAIIDRGSPGEMEKVLCSELTGSVLTISQRGYDGTTAISHNAGATVEHGLSAGVLDDLSAHVYDVTRDDHSQYLRTDGANPPTDLSLVTQAPASVGTTLAEGSVDLFARADHIHDIGAGAVDTAALADGAVTAAKFAAESWTAYTPALVQLSTRTVTVNQARFQLRGKTMMVNLDITCGNTGTAGNAVLVGLPSESDSPAGYAPAPDLAASILGFGQCAVSGTVYQVHCQFNAISIITPLVSLLRLDVTGNSPIGVSPSVAVAAGDRFILKLEYEVGP